MDSMNDYWYEDNKGNAGFPPDDDYYGPWWPHALALVITVGGLALALIMGWGG